MATLLYLEKLLLRSRRTFWVGVGLVFLVLGITVTIGWLLARTLIRDQISRRDAELLHAATLMEQMDVRRDSSDPDIMSDEQIGFDAAILASRMKGVMGIRFFDASGRFTDTFPPTIQPSDLDAHTLNTIRKFEPHGLFRDSMRMSDVFIYLPSFATGRVDRVPILEVTVPLQRQDSEELIGAAQFLVDGQGIASEYRALDRHLAGLAGQTFLIAAFLLGLILWIVFRRIERLNQQLATQNRDLSRANQELSLAARTAALGAVSAHLMHGLKNPLASLSQYVREHALEGEGNSAGQAEEWRDAVAATRRMQALVEHTTEVLADSRGDAVYEVAINEMVAEVKRRTLAQARQRGVRLSFVVAVNEPVSSRIANLAQLILVNLTENAIQATLTGGTVAIEVRAENQNLLFQVRDEGPGFPEHLRSRLFLPCPSTREGGSGIGLCICKQLADHMGATLELHPSPGGGCIFTLGISRATASNGAESGNHAAVAVGG